MSPVNIRRSYSTRATTPPLQPQPNETSIARVRSASLAIGLCVFACGPSLTAVHEGSVRFEHCYRLDLDTQVVSSHREACWKGWLTSFTYGQPRDRIDYARTRLSELQKGDPSPPALRTGSERRPEQRQFYLVVPTPTSVHAPPPPVATVWREEDGGAEPNAADAGSAETITTPPAATCADDCRGEWESCSAKCAADAGPTDAGVSDAGPSNAGPSDAGAGECAPCTKPYLTCMKKCFR